MDPVSIDTLIELARANLWIPLLAAVVGAIIRVCKSDPLVAKIPVYIKPENRAVAALVLAVIGAALDRIAVGGKWYDALAGGLVAGSGAIAGHEVIVNKVRGGRDFGVRKDPPPPTTGSPWDDDSERPPPTPAIRPPVLKVTALLAAAGLVFFLTACPGAGKVCTALDLAAKACDLILVKMPDGTEVLVPRKQIEAVALRVQAAQRMPLDPNPYLDGGTE